MVGVQFVFVFQAALQSVFLIRSRDDPILRESDTLYLVAVSLILSAFNIANKCAWTVELCCLES